MASRESAPTGWAGSPRDTLKANLRLAEQVIRGELTDDPDALDAWRKWAREIVVADPLLRDQLAPLLADH